MTGDRVERGDMPRGVLAHVEADQRQPEGRGPAEQVGEPAVGDDLLAGLDQRAITELQRFDQLVDRFVGAALRTTFTSGGCESAAVGAADLAGAGCAASRRRGAFPGRDEPAADGAKDGAIRLTRAFRRGLQLRDRVDDRQVQPQRVDFAQIPPRSAPTTAPWISPPPAAGATAGTRPSPWPSRRRAAG